jgi:zinc protease
LLDFEIARVQNGPVAEWEFKKVQMQLRRERAQRVYSSRSRATSLGHFAVYYQDPGLINSVWRNYDRVTRADLQRVARQYLTPHLRSVVTTMPKTAAKQ